MSFPKGNISQLSDTKWHIGYITKAPNDPRRDKRKCVHYFGGMCRGTVPCKGSSHCADYIKGSKTKEASPYRFALFPSGPAEEPVNPKHPRKAHKSNKPTKQKKNKPVLSPKIGDRVYHPIYKYGTVFSKVDIILEEGNKHAFDVEFKDRTKRFFFPEAIEKSIIKVIK